MHTPAEERPALPVLLVVVPGSRVAYVWLFSLARGECGEGMGVSMWRKTDRSRGKWNSEKHRLGASEKPSAPEEPESHSWESPKASAFLTTDRQTFTEPGGKERLLPAPVPSAYSLWSRTCIVRVREWSVYEWKSLNTFHDFIYCVHVCVRWSSEDSCRPCLDSVLPPCVLWRQTSIVRVDDTCLLHCTSCSTCQNS